MTQRKDPPLPPMAPGMKLAGPEVFMPLEPDSFHPVPGYGHIAVRDTNIEKLSGGAVGVRVMKPVPGVEDPGSPWHWHEWGFQIGYITKGWALFEFEGVGVVKVEAGMFLFQPANNRHREIQVSPDFEGMEITWPAKVPTHFMTHNEATGEWDIQTVVG